MAKSFNKILIHNFLIAPNSDSIVFEEILGCILGEIDCSRTPRKSLGHCIENIQESRAAGALHYTNNNINQHFILPNC